jgi:hypothetical protein
MQSAILACGIMVLALFLCLVFRAARGKPSTIGEKYHSAEGRIALDAGHRVRPVMRSIQRKMQQQASITPTAYVTLDQ